MFHLKSFPAATHILHDDFLSSISLHPAAVRRQRLGLFLPAPALAVPGLAMHGSEKWGMCFCEGHERILWNCAVNYSC